MPEVLILSCSKRSTRALPPSSLPTAPIKLTSAPVLAAAIAWFAPFPPPLVNTSFEWIVSPGFGNCSVRIVVSKLILPTTVILFISALLSI